ncbi:hypothetical protein [Ohtaekwangia sp.]|uniref:hypothetical protein n=1 Tax=Ohtaekwangia sp. TaxID=2066019 RepID=UPI002FDC824F
MMKRLSIIILIISLVVLMFTVKLNPGRIVMGFYAGECDGNCSTLYEVTEKVLRIDTTSFREAQYGYADLKIKGQRFLEEDDEGNFQSFKIDIPIIMLLEPRTRFGCPDCWDQGGCFLEFTLLGVKRQFEIEEGKEPLYFPQLTDEVSKRVKAIRNEFNKERR